MEPTFCHLGYYVRIIIEAAERLEENMYAFSLWHGCGSYEVEYQSVYDSDGRLVSEGYTGWYRDPRTKRADGTYHASNTRTKEHAYRR